MPFVTLALALALQAPAASSEPPVQVASTSPATAPAAAVAPASPPSPEAAPAPEVDDPMAHISCHYQEPEGTYFGSRKVCHTRREWLRLQHAG